MTYDADIARAVGRINTSGPRLQGLFANLNRALNANERRGLLLAFEEILIESLNVNAALLNERGDVGGARECLDLVQRLRDLVQSVIDAG